MPLLWVGGYLHDLLILVMWTRYWSVVKVMSFWCEKGL